MAGKLYLVATPIGNLEDMSFRAVKTLTEADYILAEDTRHSIKLLNHYEITKKMVSYHEHNQFTKAESILEDLR
ncbi:MAG: 16S rRNA (cytidine(1402)-2'-O)-methyltransferase, partial [Vallitaleaceae bacterium]|nr:16S rRNA (cytidine(1402)-2'-O)-methyltransferase [Vallitaleaceae bacterium]